VGTNAFDPNTTVMTGVNGRTHLLTMGWNATGTFFWKFDDFPIQSATTFAGVNGPSAGNSWPILIGSFSNTDREYRSWTGAIYEVYFSNTSPTSASIQALHNAVYGP
jgi:hypothetical protein